MINNYDYFSDYNIEVEKKINPFDYEYKRLLQNILANGEWEEQRAVTEKGQPLKALSLFGTQCKYDLSQGFPLLTIKKMFWKGITTELCWMMKGLTNVKYLQDRGVKIWDAWASKSPHNEGDLGPVYGKQWRSWEYTVYGKNTTSTGYWVDTESIDQLDILLKGIKAVKDNPRKPISRRLILSAWNVDQLDQMALPPCHMIAQFKVQGDKLHCQMYQRSADVFLGVPFNIAQYALLTHILCKCAGLMPGTLTHTLGDVHIYQNHMEQVKEILGRHPFSSPQLKIKDHCDIFMNTVIPKPWDYEPEDFTIENYQSHSALPGDIAI
jgi:thymidylate synthase